MGSYYRKLQTVKHALQYYITRPGASEKDLVREKNLLKSVEEEVEIYQERNHISKKEVEMNVTRTFLHEGKTLQEIMEILLPIYIQEKTCNINEEELEFTQQKILK